MFIGLIKKKKKTKTQIVTKVVSQFILQRFNLQKKKTFNICNKLLFYVIKKIIYSCNERRFFHAQISYSK